MKLFGIKNTDQEFKIWFFGIKISINKSKRLNSRMQNCEYNIWRLLDGDRFIQANKDKFNPSDLMLEVKKRYYECHGKWLDLKNPKTLWEKLNWLKFHYANPVENLCVDKYTAKKYIADLIGEEHVVPLLGVWEDVDDIDFNALPENVVFKNTCSGGGHGVKVVKNLHKTDINRLKYELNNMLFDYNNDLYNSCLNPVRKFINERLIAEQYIEQLDGQLNDYKFFCFNGEPKYFEVITDRIIGKSAKITFYDMDFNRLPVQLKGSDIADTNAKIPENFNEMITIAKKCAKDFPFVRVDMYNLSGKIYIGEMTFQSGGGMDLYIEDSWNYKTGEMLDLSKIDPKYIVEDCNDLYKRYSLLEQEMAETRTAVERERERSSTSDCKVI